MGLKSNRSWAWEMRPRVVLLSAVVVAAVQTRWVAHDPLVWVCPSRGL